MGAAAARLNGIEMGPGVTCPILRYNPAIIAQAAATVERMSPGLCTWGWARAKR